MIVGEDPGTRLEGIVRMVAGITVAAYAIGLFTANAYLNRIGVADFAQLRARFVFTGAIVALAFAAAFVPVREAWGGRWRGRLIALGWVAGAVAVWFVAVSLTKGGVDDDRGFGSSELRHAVWLETGALLAGIAGAWLWRRFSTSRGPITGDARVSAPAEADAPRDPGARGRSWRGRVGAALSHPPARVGVIAATTALLGGAALFVSQFGRHVYPRIPVPYGGGKAVCGRVLLAEGAEAELAALGLPQARGRATAPVPIAYEAGEFIVIGLGDDTWLRLRKELIEALQIGAQRGECGRDGT